MAFHEAGHAVAMYHSKAFDFESVTCEQRGYYATPTGRNGSIVEATTENFLDQALFAMAGQAAGELLCSRIGLAPKHPDITAGIQDDHEKFFTAAKRGGFFACKGSFLRVIRRHFEREKNWNQIEIVAGAILNRQSAMIHASELLNGLQMNGLGGGGLPRPYLTKIELWIKRQCFQKL